MTYKNMIWIDANGNELAAGEYDGACFADFFGANDEYLGADVDGVGIAILDGATYRPLVKGEVL